MQSRVIYLPAFLLQGFSVNDGAPLALPSPHSSLCISAFMTKHLLEGRGGGAASAMARVYVGNLDDRVSARDLEDEFRVFGVLRSVWVARKPPGFAFIEFDDRRDAMDAIRDLDGKHGWRVELSKQNPGVGVGAGGGGRSRDRDRYSESTVKCYDCGEPGHFARDCHRTSTSTSTRGGYGRYRTPSPPFRRSPSPSYARTRSYSPRYRSPRRRYSISPRERSPVYGGRGRSSISPYP